MVWDIILHLFGNSKKVDMEKQNITILSQNFTLYIQDMSK